MDTYTKLYEATGGKIQQTKIMFYAWQWIYKNGIKLINNIKSKLIVHNTQVIQLNANEATRTLGMHVAPNLNW